MTNYAAAPTIYKVTLTEADTEYSLVLPAGTRRFEFQNRSDEVVRFQFLSGYVATPTAPYGTIKAGGAYETYDLWGSQTITAYFASSNAGDVIEVIAWVM